MRRVDKRIQAVGLDGYTDYIDYLEVHQDEFQLLFNSILINVTAFFRDQPAWDYLRRDIVPKIIASRESEDIRIWCAGCASGEEAYSLAICFAEALGPEAFRQRVKIYATDIDEEALATARQAIYTSRQVAPIPPELLERYFESVLDRFAFRKDLRRGLIFGRHDLLRDAPISRIDLLASRNTLMYFNSDAQTRILARYYYALREGGFLFLGKAETLLSRTNNFSPVELKYRIFGKPATEAEFRNRFVPDVPTDANGNGRAADVGTLTELSFQADATAQFVVDAKMNLLLVNERARDLFALTTRDVGRALQDLDVSYRPVELRSLINKVQADRRPMTVSEIYFPSAADNDRWFDVHILPLLEAGVVSGVKVSFVDVTKTRAIAEELQQSKSDLETAYEELQSTHEELETTNEELQSTVEELETTNEELQSTNEELETMNEELQSTNEELEAANDGLRERGAEVNIANSFLEGILTSLHIGVAVVDQELRLRAWNHRAEDLWGLRASEVRGTSLLNLDIGLSFDSLLQPIRDCLAGRIENFEGTLAATNRRGRPISCHVNLRTMREVAAPDALGPITGVVILMEEADTDGDS